MSEDNSSWLGRFAKGYLEWQTSGTGIFIAVVVVVFAAIIIAVRGYLYGEISNYKYNRVAEWAHYESMHGPIRTALADEFIDGSEYNRLSGLFERIGQSERDQPGGKARLLSMLEPGMRAHQ